MKAPVEINGKTFVPVRQAADRFGYSSDHITRLAKAKKISATQSGRLWFVSEQSLESYLADQQAEAEVRKQLLRKQRKLELQVRNAMHDAEQRPTQSPYKKVQLVAVLAVACFVVALAATNTSLPSTASLTASLGMSVLDNSVDDSDSNAIKPRFSDRDGVLVNNDDRWVERPEVTSQWVTVTP